MLRRIVLGFGLTATAMIAGCAPPLPAEQGDDGGDGEAETGPVEELETPAFVDPGSGVLPVRADSRLSANLGVIEIILGQTHLTIDGRPVVLAGERTDAAALDLETAEVRFDGAMVAISHQLGLLVQGTAGLVTSAEVVVSVDPSEPLENGLLLTLDEEPTTPATRVSYVPGPMGYFALVDVDGADASLRIVTVQDADANTDVVRSMALPSVHAPDGAGPTNRAPIATRSWTVGEGEDAATFVRAVWTEGADRQRLVTRVLDLGDASASSVETVLTTGHPALGINEWARFDHAVFSARNLVVDTRFAPDVEADGPGSRGVIVMAWDLEEDGPGTPQRLTPNPLRDLSDLATTVDLVALRAGRPANSIAARFDQATPTLLREDPLTGTLGFDGQASLLDLPNVTGTDLHLATVLGSMGSRTVATYGPERFEVLLIDASATKRGEIANQTGMADLDPANISGEVAATALAGYPIFIVPRGQMETVALYSDGVVVRREPLGISCDEVAISAGITENVDGKAALVCIRDDEATFGSLAIQ